MFLSRFCLFAFAAVPAAPAGSIGVDASASAGGGRWFNRNDAPGSVWAGSFSWAQTAVIKWTVPTFSADAAPLPTAPVPFNECKFAAVPAVPPAAPPAGGAPPCAAVPLPATWTGYKITGTGTKKSTAVSTGAGSSNVGTVFYGADWTVTANGAGTFNVVAVATDP